MLKPEGVTGGGAASSLALSSRRAVSEVHAARSSSAHRWRQLSSSHETVPFSAWAAAAKSKRLSRTAITSARSCSGVHEVAAGGRSSMRPGWKTRRVSAVTQCSGASSDICVT
eukprot:6276087-Prymnesium_polylepis.1